MELVELIKRWQGLKDTAKEHEEARKEANKEADLVASAVIGLFLDEGIENIAVEGRTYYIGDDIKAVKLNDEIDRDQIVDALIASDLEHMAPRGFNWNSLSAFVRDLKREGEPIPDALAAVIKLSEAHRLGSRTK